MHLILDLDAKAGMAEPGELHVPILPRLANVAADGLLRGMSVDWFRAVNCYCERTDASYWSEPLNALSNAAFLAAAWLAWRLARRAGTGAARSWR